MLFLRVLCVALITTVIGLPSASAGKQGRTAKQRGEARLKEAEKAVPNIKTSVKKLGKKDFVKEKSVGKRSLRIEHERFEEGSFSLSYKIKTASSESQGSVAEFMGNHSKRANGKTVDTHTSVSTNGNGEVTRYSRTLLRKNGDTFERSVGKSGDGKISIGDSFVREFDGGVIARVSKSDNNMSYSLRHGNTYISVSSLDGNYANISTNIDKVPSKEIARQLPAIIKSLERTSPGSRLILMAKMVKLMADASVASAE